MEKYTRFQDPGTGIQPFLHFTPEAGTNVFTADNTLKIGIFGWILVTLRIPVYFISVALWFILGALPFPV